MFNHQRERFFQMPEFDLSKGKVKLIFTGKLLDKELARILVRNTKISFEDILKLDKVKKRKSVTDEELKYLKKAGYIERRKPNIYLSQK